MLGMHWEQERKTENNSPTLAPLKRKNNAHIECMLNLPIGCMKFLIPKLFVNYFVVCLILISWGCPTNPFFIFILQ
jgi:hypothetical protein